MSNLFESIKQKVSGKGISIVLPEGTDERILTAADRLAKEDVLKPILIGNVENVKEKASSLGLELQGVEILDPSTYGEMEQLVASFVERR